MFKVKNIEIKTSHDYIALIYEEDADELGLHPMDRVRIYLSKNNNSKKVNTKAIICEIEIIDYKKKKGSHNDINLKVGEIGLLETAFLKLEILDGEKVTLIPAKKPNSLIHVKNKFNGSRLTQKEFLEIMIDIVENRFSKIETTYFVIACAINKLSISEIVALTNSMVNVGKMLEFKNNKNSLIVDKHCIGGVPGNRTTILVVPIIAAAGLKIPKTSSRAITSPAGTADTMEIFANVNVELSKMYNLVDEENGCLVWGGGLDLSPADDIIIQVEHPLNLDSQGQMIASILSKKKSAGSEFVLIDIPIGKTAKIKNILEANYLKSLFNKVGKKIGLKIKVVITDGSQPIGNGIGALYESRDIINIFENKDNIAVDLKKKSLIIAGIILEESKLAKKKHGYFLAKNILESGLAYEKFKKIIQIQGQNNNKLEPKFSKTIFFNEELIDSSLKDNFRIIKEINNKLISKLSFVLGAPKDKVAGMYLHKKVGDLLSFGDKLITLYSDSNLRLNYGINFFEDNTIFKFN